MSSTWTSITYLIFKSLYLTHSSLPITGVRVSVTVTANHLPDHHNWMRHICGYIVLQSVVTICWVLEEKYFSWIWYQCSEGFLVTALNLHINKWITILMQTFHKNVKSTYKYFYIYITLHVLSNNKVYEE